MPTKGRLDKSTVICSHGGIVHNSENEIKQKVSVEYVPTSEKTELVCVCVCACVCVCQ